MRILLWLLPTCLALTACNVALSDHPMLAGEPRSPLKLRVGLWSLEDADCRFKAERPRRHWPKCATWVVIDDGKVVGGKDLPPGDLPVELVIADGPPPILEYPFTGESDNKQKYKGYAYLVLEPADADAGGSVSDLRAWFVACGVVKQSNSLGPNIQHFPGLNEDCYLQSLAALRAAAAAGPQGTDEKARWRWIRAGAN